MKVAMGKLISLKTERLSIKPVKLADLGDIHQLHSIPEVDEFNTLGIPENIGITKKMLIALIADWEQKEIEKYSFVIKLLGNNETIGMLAINLQSKKYNAAEIWYKLNPKFWNKGYATEAVKEILNFGFNELKLHRIEAGCAIKNIASIKVLEKVGMKREGQKRQTLPLKSGWSDNYEYGILVEEF